VAAGADVNAPPNNEQKFPPLYSAAAAGQLPMVRALIAAGADVNRRTKAGSSPLMVAAKFGRKDVVAELCEHKADVHASNQPGWTPLHAAADSGHPEVVAMLMSAGAKTDAKLAEDRCSTPLMMA